MGTKWLIILLVTFQQTLVYYNGWLKYFEGFQNWLVDLDVISWLSSWLVNNEIYENRIQLFEHSAQIQADEL